MIIRRRTSLLAASTLILSILISACGQAGAITPNPSATPTSAGTPTAVTLPAGANQPTATPAPTDTPKPLSGTPTPTITPPGYTPAPTNAATATAAAAAAATKGAGETATASAVTATAQSAATVVATMAGTPTPTAGSGSVPVTTGAGQQGSAATPASAQTVTAGLPENASTLKMANGCNLVNSSDLAHLFPPHNEITRDVPKTSQVAYPPFSPQAMQAAASTPAATPAAGNPAAGNPAASTPTLAGITSATSGTETRCLLFDFHQPGVAAGWMLQVTYLLDTPDPAAASAWAQTWNTAKSQGGQPVSGLGEDAFTSGSTLFVKQGDAYLTFESIDTHLDAKDPATTPQLIAYEKTLAAAALGRLKSTQ